ncbi:monooxygenase 1 isoform X2 [Beta vulgaris subsp. vulgaris]|uniref:monooxygenase 1 isoform X2 n=1 Tax=Beta vulgaris subsp. vulgaris TaxID=3555 RepID=UPI0020370A0F|nr:monooxygenase 1 isoform X2 [Beta vulgaris subsp. vulgaris]
MAAAEELDIVIVGGGICGLATALGLHRKGIQSVVLERSDTLRATGAAITVFPNGWRALHQLGLDSTLLSTAIPWQRAVDISPEGVAHEIRLSEEDTRCLRRGDLVEALANALPLQTIRFGCQVVSVNVEKSSSCAVLQLHDGSLIKAKVLIGCDGLNSVIANYIGLKPTRFLSTCSVRGLTLYPNGHGYAPKSLRVRKDKHYVGRIPIDEKTVYWFVALEWIQKDAKMPKDPASIRQLALDRTAGFSKDIVEMIENSDLSSLSLTRLRYRAPWNLLSRSLRRETITVAGDAWHAMGPFLGQGGSVALEDAVVLARCLSKKICNANMNRSRMHLSTQMAKDALDEYLKERRRRVVLLSTLTYLTGLLTIEDLSLLLRLLCIIIFAVVFRDRLNHTRYDCGEL